MSLADNGKTLHIEVRDDGPGISEAFRAKLFQPYQRDRLNEQVGGTGLGLFISKRLVAAMHGTLGYRQRSSGKGSVFVVEVPILSSEANAARMGETVEHASVSRDRESPNRDYRARDVWSREPAAVADVGVLSQRTSDPATPPLSLSRSNTPPPIQSPLAIETSDVPRGMGGCARRACCCLVASVFTHCSQSLSFL